MIIAEYCEKIGHHELQAARAEEERRILQEELWRQQRDFREVHQQSLTEMEELRKFQSSTFDTLARRKLIEDQNTIMELSGRLQEQQNEVNCMNDSKDFQDAESVRSGNSHVTSQPMLFPKHPISEGLLRPSFVSPRRKEGPPCIWDTHGISGNVFANPHASSSTPYPQELNPWGTTIEEPRHMSTAEKTERPEHNRDLKCQSGSSAKDSVIFSGGDSSKNYGADQQRLQISDLHFDKFPTPATFACWKIRFKTEVCTCSQFPTEAMQWIKEVELVDSVDDLRSSSSRGISMPNFEVLDARIASALNKIIHNSQFKRRISLEEQKAQKQDSFLRGRQIAYLIYDHFRVTGTHDSVENYTDLFTIVVKSTSPVPENHNKNGSVNYTIITRTSSRPMRTTIMTPSTPTRMTRTIAMRAICTSEHSSALLVVFHVSLMMCHTTLAQVVHVSVHPHTIHDVRFSLTSSSSLSTSTCPSPSSSTPLS